MARESWRELKAYFGSLVHRSARNDAVTLVQHRSFISSHLLAGLIALIVFPLYLALTGRPSLFAALIFVWFLSPIAIAVFLSKTGRLGAAHLLSAINLAALVSYASSLTGGIESAFIPWIVIVPIESALSTERRIVGVVTAIAVVALCVLAFAGWFGLLPEAANLPVPPLFFALFGAASACLYAATLAVTIQTVNGRSAEGTRAGDERYRVLAENAADMITHHDERSRVLFASQGTQLLLGETPFKVQGEGLFERVHVADRPAYLTALTRAHRSNEPITIEFRLRHGPIDRARYIWVEMHCRSVVDEGWASGRGSSVVAVTRDISGRKAQQEELFRARDEAERASIAKTKFLANMSHELRTPLNAVIGFSEILAGELFGSLGEERYRDYARLIHESGEHLLNVVNDILDMSKIEAGKFKIVMEPFDVSSLVASCCDIMRHAAETKGIVLTSDVMPNLPELAADKRACKQMLLNVMSNAIKFTERGGSVHVSAKRRDNAIELVVGDNGIGIAEEDLPKLGNPFVQADNSYNRSYEGAGLGLSVVKGLARLHGGELEITSRLGEGTTARIILPVERVAAEPPIQLPSASAA